MSKMRKLAWGGDWSVQGRPRATLQQTSCLTRLSWHPVSAPQSSAFCSLMMEPSRHAADLPVDVPPPPTHAGMQCSTFAASLDVLPLPSRLQERLTCYVCLCKRLIMT